MTNAEKICINVREDVRSQVVTLANAVIAMQEKIDQQIPIYKQMPLAQQVTVGTGEKMLRQNPATQEFRATVRDYSQALNNLYEIIEAHAETENLTSLDAFRSKVKIAK